MMFVLFTHGLFLALAIVGGLIAHAMVRDWLAGTRAAGEAAFVGLFGLLLLVIGAGFFFVLYAGAPRWSRKYRAVRRRYRDRPWMVRRQWRARRIVHSTKHTAWFMWFWCLAWWGILGFLYAHNHELIHADLKGPWSDAIPAALPFVAGIAGLLVAAGLTWQRLRYGDAVLLVDTLPGFLGDRFRSRIEAYARSRPNEPVRLSLLCGSMRRERRPGTSGRMETIFVTDELWSAEKQLQPAEVLFASGRARIPVDLELPADLPESGDYLDEPQTVWKLKLVPGSVLDRSLACEFEIPVFARR